jgi:hypothetical protein
MAYDSTRDTQEHVNRVAELLYGVAGTMKLRANVHDASKFVEPEKSAFDAVTPRLKDLTYGSDEYKAELKNLGPALAHHYEHNTHHPEHFANGIDGMSLFDLVEMLMDWKAAGERMDGGDIRRSLAINKNRFGISDQLWSVLANTVEEMGW